MQKNNLKYLAKEVTFGLVLGTALTATSSAWAEETHVKDDATPTPNSIFTYDTEKQTLKYGDGAIASGQYSTAFGDGAQATGSQSIALGLNAKANMLSTALGLGAEASGAGSTAIGNTSTA